MVIGYCLYCFDIPWTQQLTIWTLSRLHLLLLKSFMLYSLTPFSAAPLPSFVLHFNTLAIRQWESQWIRERNFRVHSSKPFTLLLIRLLVAFSRNWMASKLDWIVLGSRLDPNPFFLPLKTLLNSSNLSLSLSYFFVLANKPKVLPSLREKECLGVCVCVSRGIWRALPSGRGLPNDCERGKETEWKR